MIAGAENWINFIVKHYAEPDAESIFKDFFKEGWKLAFNYIGKALVW